MKSYTFYIHPNKHKKCWTVHSSKLGCLNFQHIQINKICETIYLPHKKDNPKFFIKVKGVLIDEGDYAKII